MTSGDRLGRFVGALHQTPIPAAPLPRDHRLEVLGLNLLDLALNHEHIGRMAEVLTVTDATHLTRQVSLELEVAALAPARLSALAHDRTDNGQPRSVWLPLARQPRGSSGSVVVTDVEGHQFPTLSTQLTEQAVIQGLDTFIAFTGIARRNGFGLDVTDRRLGRVKGQWWTVLRADPDTYQARRRELYHWAPVEPPRSRPHRCTGSSSST